MKSYRKSSRTYDKKKISYEIIRKIIDDAINYSPSSCNHQMWHFIAIDNSRLKEKIFRISNQSHFKEASWIIFITTQYGWNHNKFSVIQSVAAASQMILFFADQEGLVGCWNAGIGNTIEIKKILKINKNFGVIGAITLGYPGDKSNFEIKAAKREIDNVLSRNIFKRPKKSIYPLKGKKEPDFWKAMNNSNIYAVHSPRKWSFSQIGNFRSFSVFAKSPFPSTYFSKRFKFELNKELFANKHIEKLFLKSSNLEILEILPFGGQYTNLLSKKGSHNINIAEYSENNFKYIQSRITAQNLKKISFIKINEKGKILNIENNKFDIIYCIQSVEEYPKEKILISEIKNLCTKDTYVVLSIRNLFSWYGIQFYLKTVRNQVPNFGPHLPINPFSILNSIKKEFDIIDIYGISPSPKMPGKKVKNFLLKYFCRLLVIVCKAKDL